MSREREKKKTNQEKIIEEKDKERVKEGKKITQERKKERGTVNLELLLPVKLFWRLNFSRPDHALIHPDSGTCTAARRY